ncbi:MAG: SGNH/GDSL hydrolase family protein [Desulfobacteraceae bacterium]|nr:SGNH/GDSL hydrolase family protein [Desulfobacteraceae bacterium]
MKANPSRPVAAYIALSLVMLLVFGEVSARLADAFFALRIQDQEETGQKPHGRRFAWKPIHRYLYYDHNGCVRLKPGAVGIHRSYDHPDKAVLIRVNKEGIRGPELLDNPENRILFIGDSIVFDGGVPLKTTFVYQLEQKLNGDAGKGGRHRTEILNFGTSDAGVDQYYLKLKYHGASLKPDFVFIGLYLNDGVSPQGYLGAENLDGFERWLESDFLQPFSLPAHALKWYRRVKYAGKRELRERFRWVARYRKGEYLHDAKAFQQMVAEADLDWGAGWVPARWEKISYYLQKIKNLCDRLDIRPVVFFFPVGPQIYAKIDWPALDYPQRQIEKISTQIGIPFFDLLPYLRELSDKQLLNDQCHYNSEGNDAVAEILFRIIKENDRIFGGLARD